MMNNQDYDPWGWVDEKKLAAPLSASIQPAQEPNPGAIREQNPLLDTATGIAMSKGIGLAEKGAEAATLAFKAPLAAGAAEGAAAAGAGSLAGAVGAGSTAMMGALASNPIGWAIGAGLLAKKLKLF